LPDRGHPGGVQSLLERDLFLGLTGGAITKGPAYDALQQRGNALIFPAGSFFERALHLRRDAPAIDL